MVFLKEHYIDTSVYAENLKDKIELQGTDEDEIFKGLNNYFRKLAERQIRIARRFGRLGRRSGGCGNWRGGVDADVADRSSKRRVDGEIRHDYTLNE